MYSRITKQKSSRKPFFMILGVFFLVIGAYALLKYYQVFSFEVPLTQQQLLILCAVGSIFCGILILFRSRSHHRY